MIPIEYTRIRCVWVLSIFVRLERAWIVSIPRTFDCDPYSKQSIYTISVELSFWVPLSTKPHPQWEIPIVHIFCLHSTRPFLVQLFPFVSTCVKASQHPYIKFQTREIPKMANTPKKSEKYSKSWTDNPLEERVEAICTQWLTIDFIVHFFFTLQTFRIERI